MIFHYPFIIANKKRLKTNKPRLNFMQVAPTQSLVENAGEKMDVVLLPRSFTSFDLLTEDSSNLRTTGTDYSSRSSF